MRALLVMVASLVSGCAVAAQALPSRGWVTYRNGEAGYAVRHPRSWHADTLAPMPGVVYTTLAPPGGGPAIHVYTYPGTGPGTDNPLPDVGCHPVTVHRVHGRRCRKLLGGAPVTVLVHSGRTYRIDADAGVGTAVYDRVVRSFRLIHQRVG